MIESDRFASALTCFNIFNMLTVFGMERRNVEDFLQAPGSMFFFRADLLYESLLISILTAQSLSYVTCVCVCDLYTHI